MARDELTWRLICESEEPSHKLICSHLTNKTVTVLDILRGKGVWIGYSANYEILVETNSHLSLHLGSRKYHGTSIVMLYSKSIQKSIRSKLDSLTMTIFECGHYTFWNKGFRKRMNTSDWTQQNREDTLGLFTSRGIFYTYLFAIGFTILSFIIEVIVNYIH